MTPQPEQASASVTRCWCCGNEYPESELVRLGQHPAASMPSSPAGVCPPGWSWFAT